MYTKYMNDLYPAWTDFKTLFLHHFCLHDVEGKVQLQLAQMCQGTEDIVTFNSKFSMVAHCANLDDNVGIQYYMHAIKPALQACILNMDTAPTTIGK